MTDLEWLRSYVGADVSLHEKPREGEAGAKASKVLRKKAPKSKKKEPWLPGFPNSDDVIYMTAQLFDNGENPGRGKAKDVLKLRVHTGDAESLDVMKPDWHRYVHLLEPSTVMNWAAEQHQNGGISDAEFDHYSATLRDVANWTNMNPSGWAKVGHIASPPGTHYFPGQFVVLRAAADEMEVTVCLYGQEFLRIDQMRENTRSKNRKSPTHYGHYDPRGLRSEGDNDE